MVSRPSVFLIVNSFWGRKRTELTTLRLALAGQPKRPREYCGAAKTGGHDGRSGCKQRAGIDSDIFVCSTSPQLILNEDVGFRKTSWSPLFDNFVFLHLFQAQFNLLAFIEFVAVASLKFISAF